MVAKKASKSGRHFIDRNGAVYSYILPFLEDGRLHQRPADGKTRALLTREADFLALSDLRQLLETHVSAPIPSNDEARLARLRGLQLESRVNEKCFEDLAKIMAMVHRSPIATLSLVDRQREFYLSRVGFGYDARPRAASISAHMLVSADASPLIVENTALDTRFVNNPLVTGAAHVKSYAGCPLMTSDGFRLGAFCTMDTRSRQYTAYEIAIQANLSYLAMQEIERSELMDRQLDSVDFNQSMDAFSLRLLRMQQAAKQLIALVHVGETVEDYRLLYTNSVWNTTTGASITPPQSLREVALATGPGVPWKADKQPDNGPTLWHWLKLEGETEEAFDERVRAKLFEHNSSTLCLKASLGSQAGKFIGRIARADVPLDCACALPRPRETGTDTLDCAPDSGGRLFFVLLEPRID
eukprot:TRINITY_DN25110_c0_g1_i1.p1 TRINITY_DN25110_c0_g1~~TRINITY_DN25110_c0_g1_i1.p1  ORF type:complete len:469 (-),score=71.05 TRINITY_DN25110_c0_g1_i1:110-1348(-)